MQTLRKMVAIACVALATTQPAWAAKPYEGVTLRVISTSQPWDVGLQKFAASFTEETGAKVEFDLFPFGQTVQKIAVELSTRSPAYDLVFLEGDSAVRFAASKFLVPLGPYLTDRKTVPQDPQLADFIPSTLRAFEYQGGLFALPHFAATQVMYYRADMLKAAGLSGPPKTWADLAGYCAKLHTPASACTAMRGRAGTSENIWYWSQIFYGHGGRFFKNHPQDMTPTVNTPQAVEAANFYANLMNRFGIVGSASASFDEVVVAMQQGNIALAIEGAPLAGRILDPKLSKVIGMLGFAAPPAGPKGLFAPFTAQGYGVNAASKNKEAAARFLAWATSAATMKRIALDGAYLGVPRSSLWKDKDFLAKHDYNFGHGSFAAAYQAALESAPEWYRTPIRDFRQVADRVGTALQEVAVGRKSAQQALDEAQKDIELQMKRAAP